MSIQTDISQALYQAVYDAVLSSTIINFPIKYPGRTLNPPNDNKYIEVVHISNNLENECWDSSRTFQGILRILLHWKNDDAGDIPAKLYLSEIAGYFSKGKILRFGLASVLIYDNPNDSSAIENGQDCIFPLSVMYRDFQP
jgi:hypothetical protein